MSISWSSQEERAREFAERMRAAACERDPDESHQRMVRLMCGMLDFCGYGEAVSVFLNVERLRGRDLVGRTK